MKKVLITVVIVLALVAGFFLGKKYESYSSQTLAFLSQKASQPEFFRYSLPDGSEFARGRVEQIANNNVIYLSTSDELIPIATSALTRYYTASYPFDLNQRLKDGNFNNVHHYDRIDVRFKKIANKNEAISVLVWTNLRIQKAQ